MNSRFALLSVGFTLLCTGCEGGGSNDIVPFKHKNDYQIASCQYGFNDGGQAERSGAADYRKFLFDKQLDYSKIRAIAKASAAETIEFVRKEGVSVYATHEADEGLCSMFESLPAAPSDLQSKFTKANGSRNDKSFIVGLFIPKDTQEIASSVATPEIAMRKDANRWTLVHEFAHYLFDIEFRRTGGQHTDELKERYTDTINAYNSASRLYVRNPTQVNFEDSATKIQAAYQASREIVIRYYAEEMAIETMLRNGVYTAELLHLPFEKRSSYYYIYTSGTGALKELSKFGDEIEHLMTEAADQSFWTAYDKLAVVRKDLNLFKSKITTEASDAEFQYKNAAETAGGVKQVVAPCVHLTDAQELTAGAKLGAL